MESDNYYFVNTADAWNLPSSTINSTYLGELNTCIASKNCLQDKSNILAVLCSTFKLFYLESLWENPKQKTVICTKVYLKHIILSCLMYPLLLFLFIKARSCLFKPIYFIYFAFLSSRFYLADKKKDRTTCHCWHI